MRIKTLYSKEVYEANLNPKYLGQTLAIHSNFILKSKARNEIIS